MADNQSKAPEMPEPTPVFVVNSQHIYTGRVHNQFYIFLWFSVALVLGCAFPWKGVGLGGGWTALQLGLLTGAIGCTWACIANIKSGRLTFWPILALEIVAVVVLYAHLDMTQRQEYAQRDAALKAINAEPVPMNVVGKAARMDWQAQKSLRFKTTKEVHSWGLGDLFLSGLAVYIEKDQTSLDRKRLDRVNEVFGTGFRFTVWTVSLLFLFVIASIVFAIATAKPKEDPSEARRRARLEGRGPGKDAKKSKGPATDEGAEKKDGDAGSTPSA
ncbi:MAG TPA: hypothetical protein ENK43_17530 [Planctomycetes bacterium]|nr:hypothetical protein [Planctomycetota bacterium]